MPNVTSTTSICQRNCLIGKKKGTSLTSRIQAARIERPFWIELLLACNNKKRYDYRKENNAQDDGDPEQSALHATAGSEDTARISAGQSA